MWPDAKHRADKLRNALREIYAEHHDIAEVRPEAFPHLDLAFYDSTAKTFTEHGFRILGDIEDRTVSGKVNARRVFMRCLTDDESIGVGIYNFQLAGWPRWVVLAFRNLRVVDVGSEFSDGTFMTTSNAWHARHVKLPPEIQNAYYRPETTPLTLLETHRARRDAYLAQHPGVVPIVASTIQDEIASAQRSTRLKAAFRAQTKYRMTREELRAHAQDLWMPGATRAADELADAADDASPAAPAPSTPHPARQVLLWLLLVVFFVAMYRLTAH